MLSNNKNAPIFKEFSNYTQLCIYELIDKNIEFKMY